MSRFPRFERLTWRLAVVFSGGSLVALDSCDPTVKATVLSGLETAATGLATTFIQAFFVNLQTDDSGGTTGPAAVLQTAHDLLRMLA